MLRNENLPGDKSVRSSVFEKNMDLTYVITVLPQGLHGVFDKNWVFGMVSILGGQLSVKAIWATPTSSWVDYRQYFGYISSTMTREERVALNKEIPKKAADLKFLGKGTGRI
jgi:hypothetical protein